MSRSPRVALIVPARGAHATIERCLDALASQSYRDFETVVVDDAARTGIGDLLVSRFPGVRHLHVPGCEPSRVRDLGAEASVAPLLAFTEPDAYARPDWLERMVRAHDETGEAIAGAIGSFGAEWLARGVRLCNFAKWLPAGRRREVDVVPGASLLLRRRDWAAAGGFPGERFIGEVVFSHALRARGRGIVLEPAAVVDHHYAGDPLDFLAERWNGGLRYGAIQARQRGNDRLELLWWLAISALPVRMAKFSFRLAALCIRSGLARELLVNSPVVALGLSASLAGEAVAYARLLARPPA